MAIITRDSPPCNLEEWISYTLKTSVKREKKSPRTSSIITLIERAFYEGCKQLDIKAIVCLYNKKDNDADALYLETPEGAGFCINAAAVVINNNKIIILYRVYHFFYIRFGKFLR